MAIEGPKAVYRDKSLLPKEGIRLAALGMLAGDGPMRYADLAQRVRRFTGTFWGPTLDVMSSSIELLGFEGLIEVAPAEGESDGGLVTITEAGRRELNALLLAPVRSPSSDFNKLVVALKLRYLHLLAPEDRRDQLLALAEGRMAERARLADLRARDADGSAALNGWLDHEIAQIDADVALFARLGDEIGSP